MAKVKRNVLQGVKCPICDSYLDIGFLGGNMCRRFFCSNCYTEFYVRGELVVVEDWTDE